MKTDIIFSRTNPLKKLEIIQNLKGNELWATSKSTIVRIIKETGRNRYKSRDKELYINQDRRTGNNWNSTIESISLVKGKLYVGIYLQYENTDTSTCETYEEFFQMRTYRGEIVRDDWRGNSRTYYYNYSVDEKSEVIRSILLEYVYIKYAEKLKKEGVA